jgi:hypothetical protein
MTISTISPALRAATKAYQTDQQGLPPLENGGRLSIAEFERRYEAMPDLKKAELIEGRVYIPVGAVNRKRIMLEHGMHLGDDEFLRLNAALPAVKKAELIEGVVYSRAFLASGSM